MIPRCTLGLIGVVLLALPVSAADGEKAKTEETPRYLGSESIADCMANWDAGTHMTKAQWRKTCERIRAERLPYLKEQGHVE